MKVSQKTEYGLRAMVALAILAGQEQPISLPTIAESEAIPEQFLDQIVGKLRRAGFVKSVRGVNGGYMLSRPPEDISVGALVRVLEGSLSPIGCVTDRGADDGQAEENASENFCGRIRGCHTRSVWLRVTDAITRALDSISLADVMLDEVGVGAVVSADR
ncbi:Rrf2 family transcriptional regulator [Alicyclobacillus cycloheptanicus]|uniref:Rrf2 family protein n=1 Tax=Alicyclobacillus cycloheptanicus TaxID=1457 RepID=A0ABT9XJW2_9BACL|nr:Rrf2 family transcriptional regulator [Alicyclobacillus cycloheptanicus]MDQ0190597.1 Rrf2 family protein [Alicyclobacillus cycloheptanicus]WDM01803.1 Rrf2 family transcriptional regulator [Alicyclobacillus cycloheptanicus]